MNNRKAELGLLLVFLIGLSLLLYPALSDYWNSFHSSQAIGTYSETVAALSAEEYDCMLAEAQAYNQSLTERENLYVLSERQDEQYRQLLNLSGTGLMGYIEINCIDVELPIYHTTSNDVLQVAVGHLEWTSLPVGGEGSHCVLSGHRGLPSARLFTDLYKLVVGDTFVLRVLDEVLTYEVDQILIVEPRETDELRIVEGKDYCTLVTCTPYGINTHRILVRGHRIENPAEAEAIRITSDAVLISSKIIAIFLAIPLLILFEIRISMEDKWKKLKSRRNSEK